MMRTTPANRGRFVATTRNARLTHTFGHKYTDTHSHALERRRSSIVPLTLVEQPFHRYSIFELMDGIARTRPTRKFLDMECDDRNYAMTDQQGSRSPVRGFVFVCVSFWYQRHAINQSDANTALLPRNTNTIRITETINTLLRRTDQRSANQVYRCLSERACMNSFGIEERVDVLRCDELMTSKLQFIGLFLRYPRATQTKTHTHTDVVTERFR